MKKKFSILVLFILFCSLFCGCSDDSENSSDKHETSMYSVYFCSNDIANWNKVYVYAESNSLVFENTNYSVDYNQKLSKEDIQIKWMTLSGSTEAKKSDQLGLANVKILKDGSVFNEKVISFVGKGVKTITEVIG